MSSASPIQRRRSSPSYSDHDSSRRRSSRPSHTEKGGRDARSRSPYRKPTKYDNERSGRRRLSPDDSEDSKNQVRHSKRRRSYSRSRSRDRDTDRKRRRSRSRSKERNRDRRPREEDHRRKRRDGSGDRANDHSKDLAPPRDRSRSRSRDKHRRKRHGDRDRSREHRHGRRYRSRSWSRSRGDKRSSRRSPSRSPVRKRGPLPSQDVSFRSGPDAPSHRHGDDQSDKPEKHKPNFSNTGALAREANRVQPGSDVILKYHEPSEARKPPEKNNWSLLVFKGEDVMSSIPLHQRSCWLFGREAKVADVHAEHPSISGQHAVIQFRYVEKKVHAKRTEDEFGLQPMEKVKGKVRPYLIDLESANGTKLNNEPIDKAKYVEIKSGDVVKLADSTREYVVILPPSEG